MKVPERAAFWLQDCPQRGPALTHVHWNKCPDGHRDDQCCHCGQSPYGPSEETPDAMEDIRAKRETPTEPRMITGRGAQGSYFGQGRGALSAAQKKYLLAVAEQVGDKP